MAALTNEKRAAILALNEAGIYPDEIARTLKVSPQAIARLLSIDDGVKTKNVNFFAKFPNNSYGAEDFEYCCKNHNVNSNEFKESTRLERINLVQEKAQKKYEATKAIDIPDEEPKSNATPVYFQQMLLNQAKIIDLFEQLCDVVIPAYITEINKNANENRVQLCEKMRCEFDSVKLMLGDSVRQLQSIKDNTKKKR